MTQTIESTGGDRRGSPSGQGMARRQWMQRALTAGAAGAGFSLGLMNSLAAADGTRIERRSARAKSVIMIFNSGAPSHIDLWDPKPQAVSEIRGPFSVIPTCVPGLEVTELLGKLAPLADKLAVVRTLYHTHGQHNSGMYWSIAGRPYAVDNTLINPGRTEVPSFGTLIGWLAIQSGYSSPLPPCVITPAPHCDSTVYITPGQFGACLGSRFDPFVLNADPNAADFRVPNLDPAEGLDRARVAARRELWDRLDRSTGSPWNSPLTADMRVNQSKALSLMSSDAVGGAFDLSREPAAVRDRYGRHSWGQSHLLARRLVEAGVPFVSTVNGPSIVWDTHKDNEKSLRERLVPPMETAYAALLSDLSERGLLDSTLVVWMGDFGRTPLINKDGGRDHWPQCYSMVLAGGGIRGGQVVGQSDKIGGEPWQRPVTPADIHATIFTALGYDPHAIQYQMADGRPMPLSEGTRLPELL